LGLSKETTRTQMNNAMRRLGVHTRSHAVTIALCEGWISCQH
jgi:DNA-binding CsgD family transcriptional regulator